MGSITDQYIPTKLTRAYREAQDDPKFRGWLEMQAAVMDIVFPIEDLPEIQDLMFTPESLDIVEAKLLDTFATVQEGFQTDTTLMMRYLYYIGETFRRHTESRRTS